MFYRVWIVMLAIDRESCDSAQAAVPHRLMIQFSLNMLRLCDSAHAVHVLLNAF